MSAIINGNVCDLLEICRICLKKCPDLMHIFTTSSKYVELNIADIITIIGGTQVCKDESLALQICCECLDDIHLFYEFRQQIIHNYEELLMGVKAYQIRVENEFDDPVKVETIENMVALKHEDYEQYDSINDEDYIPENDEKSNDEDYAPEKVEKSKRKKAKKCNNKKKTKGSKTISKRKTTSLKKNLSVISDINKSFDKLSAALQKRLENRDKCPLCFEKLKENETMANHFYSHYENSNLTPLIVNGKKTAACNICDKNYKFNSLIPHHRKHLKLFPFKCEIEGCDKAFASTMNLGWHMDNHNGVKKYQCQTCGKTFHLSGSLRNHEETHIIERAQCKICFKTYKNHIMLKLHMKRHIYGQRHKCEEPGCDRAFYSAQELRKHAHVHYGSKSFICDVCSKPWYTEKDLLRHKKYHDPVKQHQCSECMKTFVDKSQLRCHEMIHRGERPHVCEYCNTGFITKSKLKRHQVKSCKGAKDYGIL